MKWPCSRPEPFDMGATKLMPMSRRTMELSPTRSITMARGHEAAGILKLDRKVVRQ
jgi:hypothetical protein